MTESVVAPAPTPAAPAAPQVALQKIYLKDASLELPNAPAVFTKQEQPSIDLQLNTNAQNLGGDNFQVTLSVTITAKSLEQALVKAAGILGVTQSEVAYDLIKDETANRGLLSFFKSPQVD